MMMDFLGGSAVKNLLPTQERRPSTPGSGRSPEKEKATQSSILAWRIPWTEQPGRPQSIGSQSWTPLSDSHTHTHAIAIRDPVLFTEHGFSRPFSRECTGRPRPMVSAPQGCWVSPAAARTTHALRPLCRDAPSLPVPQRLGAVAPPAGLYPPATCERADWKPPSCWVAPSDPYGCLGGLTLPPGLVHTLDAVP